MYPKPFPKYTLIFCEYLIKVVIKFIEHTTFRKFDKFGKMPTGL